MNKTKKIEFLLIILIVFISCGTKQKIDSKNRLHDIWVATHINDTELQINNERSRPQLEIKVAEKKVLGKGGCNRFFGNLDIITETELIFSDKLGSTKMACPNMNIEDSFFKALLASKTYKIENNNLHLFNESNKEVIRFKKID